MYCVNENINAKAHGLIFDNFDFSLKMLQPLMATAWGM